MTNQNTSKMLIRKYKDSDKDSLLELLKLNTPTYFAPEEREDLIDYLANHIEYYYVVEVDGKILGCGGFNLTEDRKTAKISWDIIHPDSQGKGVGSALTKFRIQRIKEIEGIQTVSVRTSQLVFKFYEKFGLELKEKVKDFWAEGLDMYRLECDINATLE